MSELSREQKKDYAKNLYLSQDGITQKEVASRAGVTETTIGKWIQQGRWEEMKTCLLMTREEQLARMYRQLRQANDAIENKPDGEQFPSSREADAIRKLTASIKQLEVEMSVSDKIELCKQLLSFARKTESADVAKQLGRIADNFIKYSIK